MEMAAIRLRTTMESLIINSLVSKAGSYCGGDITPKEVRQLKNIILPKIQTVIGMAESIPADKLQPWLMDLRASALEAEYVLDSCEYKNIQDKISGHPESLNKLKAMSKQTFAGILPKTALKNSFEKLQESANEADELLKLIHKTRMAASPRDTKSQQSSTTVSRLPSPVFGRGGECNVLINMLINEPSNDSSGIPVLAVQGIGGAGKTTVAQCIYGDPRVERHFDTKMWVHVSRKFDTRRVTIEIIESATQGREKCSDTLNLDTLQGTLEKLLNSKKFLLVLDDVWCEDRGEWDKLLVPLNKSVGSRILITTRMERVALKLGVQKRNILSLKDLRSEDCWSILKHYAFGDANKAIEDQDLAATGEKIVDKLKNSPLAARLVGSLLGRKVDVGAWEMILKEDVLEGTLDSLLLSFRLLPHHLQTCFAFCSLYPKGYSFSKKALARLWVAEGFVEASTEDGLTAIEKGQQYFDELLSCSFFQPKLTYPYYGYIIHDLLHDLAEEVSKGHSFRIEDESPANIPPTVVHLSVVGGLPMSSLDAWELVNLRTFMHIVYGGNDTITEDMLETLAKYKTLRVLHLQSSIDKLSSSIGKLKLLRYLKVHEVKELPESLGILYHLQFLILEDSDIERAPKTLNNLVNLRHLISGPKKGIRILEIGRLTLLQTLRFYHVERSKGYGIEQLKNLQQIRGSLTIEGLENAKNKTDAIEARLKQKEHLKELTLVWREGTNRDGRADEEVLEGLEPPPNLRMLDITGYLGANLTVVPHWLPASLERLYINFCEDLSSLPENLEKLSSLKILEVNGCRKMESLPNLPTSLKQLNIKFCGNLLALSENLEKLSSLEILEINGCPKMESLPNLPTSLKLLCINFCGNLLALPENMEELCSLQRLHIWGCLKMESLPNLPTSLKELGIFLCNPQLAEKYGKGGPLRHEINHIPNITIQGEDSPRFLSRCRPPGFNT